MRARERALSFCRGNLMTKKSTLLLVISLTIASACFARLEMWPVTQKPWLTLSQVETIAAKTITERHKDYFCIGATFAQLGAKAQEWTLSYTNPKGERKWVIIDGEGKAQVLDNLGPS